MALNDRPEGTIVSADRKALDKILNAIKIKCTSRNVTFGENINFSNAGNPKEAKKDVVANLANIIFSKDLSYTAGESHVASNEGVNNKTLNKLVKAMKEEYLARGYNLVEGRGEAFTYGASGSALYNVYNTNLPTFNQLLLVSLSTSIIKPIHNKVIKSIVDNSPVVERTQDVPFLRTEKDGKIYDYFSVLNDPLTLNKLVNGGQPRISVTVDMTQSTNKLEANGNLVEIYNNAQQAAGKTDIINMKSGLDFIAKGVKITEVVYNDGAKDHTVAVEIVSTGDQTQSGEVGTNIAIFNTEIEAEDQSATNPKSPFIIELLGKIMADGRLAIRGEFRSDKPTEVAGYTFKSVTFEFVIPSKGAQNPVTVLPNKSLFKNRLFKKASQTLPLNEYLLSDYKVVLNTDLVDTFNASVIQQVNHTKDGYLLEVTETMEDVLSAANSNLMKFVDRKNPLSKRSVYAYEALDVNVFDYRFANFVEGNNLSLASSFFDVMNKIDKSLNPEEKNFSIVSSSSASKWIKSEGRDIAILSISSELNNPEVGGIRIPYSMKVLNVFDSYTGTYIASNYLDSAEVPVDLDGKGTNFGYAKKHRYHIYTRFEEKLDGMIFYHGLEKISQGVNNEEYDRDLTLNYETRYDIITYNKAAAVVDFTEGITSKKK